MAASRVTRGNLLVGGTVRQNEASLREGAKTESDKDAKAGAKTRSAKLEDLVDPENPENPEDPVDPGQPASRRRRPIDRVPPVNSSGRPV